MLEMVWYELLVEVAVKDAGGTAIGVAGGASESFYSSSVPAEFVVLDFSSYVRSLAQ
jgi:hypothetical protein